MPKVSQMQGVSAHLEVLKSDGHRRHPAHCIYAIGKGKNRKCNNANYNNYQCECHSAVRCSAYADDKQE